MVAFTRLLVAISALWTSSLIAEAQADIELCSNAKHDQICAPLNFQEGLGSTNYQDTLLAISPLIEEDFKFHLNDSHGPFSAGKTPTVDYELNFSSAAYDSNIHGNFNFIVLHSATKIKSFGIIVLRNGRVSTQVPITVDDDEYALVESNESIYFVYTERFTKKIVQFPLK